MIASEIKTALQEKNLVLSPLFIAATAKGEEVVLGILSSSYYNRKYVLKFKEQYHFVHADWELAPELSFITIDKMHIEDIFNLKTKNGVKVKIKSFGDGTKICCEERHTSGNYLEINSKSMNIEHIKQSIKKFVRNVYPKQTNAVELSYSEQVLAGTYTENC